MWFKNLFIFSLAEAFTLSPEDLEQKFEQMVFHPCGNQQLHSFGWTPPAGKSSQLLVHNTNGFLMICGKKEERILPTSVINEMTQEKIAKYEEQRGHTLRKKERDTLRDETIFELLPRAFTHSSKTYAYIDPKGGWLIVDAASANKAEDLLNLLRKSIGSLPAIPINRKILENPVSVMTHWLTQGQVYSDLAIDDECELRAPEEDGGIIRCKRHDLNVPEIKNHLDTGKEVLKLAVTWDDRLSFVIDENLAIKRLKFLDLIQTQAADINTESEAERFDADFSIMSLELANFLPRLLELFGGEVPAN